MYRSLSPSCRSRRSATAPSPRPLTSSSPSSAQTHTSCPASPTPRPRLCSRRRLRSTRRRSWARCSPSTAPPPRPTRSTRRRRGKRAASPSSGAASEPRPAAAFGGRRRGSPETARVWRLFPPVARAATELRRGRLFRRPPRCRIFVRVPDLSCGVGVGLRVVRGGRASLTIIIG